MKDLFTSSGYLHNPIITMVDGESFDLSQLAPFLRVLLTTDGTVTKSLESYFWEPIKVTRIFQGEEVLARDAEAIGKVQGDSVLSRRVVLQGVHSQRDFVRAQSYVCLDLLPINIRLALQEERLGTGELLSESGLETYRELMAFGLSVNDSKREMWRTYRIMLRHQPCIQITEYFDTSLFET